MLLSMAPMSSQCIKACVIFILNSQSLLVQFLVCCPIGFSGWTLILEFSHLGQRAEIKVIVFIQTKKLSTF